VRGDTYTDDEAAALYEVLNPWGPGDDFYLGLVRGAASALDVGCGTGTLLRRARDRGHTGRLCGLDPDRAMLGVARTRSDVEWVEGTAAALRFEGEFELATMAGHAFQCLVSDDELRDSLSAIRRALVPGGRFAFETRNPLARAWEEWPELALDAVDPAGRTVRVSYEVEPVAGDVVTLVEVTSDAGGRVLRADRASLRFLDVESLDRFLADAGFELEARYGSWNRTPHDAASPEIVTIARAVG